MRSLLSFVLLVLAGCAASTSAPITLEGTGWKLTEIAGHAPVAGAEVTLQFSGDHAAGFASCNQYRAPYTAGGSALGFGAAIATKRACAEAARNAQETAYLGAIGNVASYATTGDALTLSDAEGTPLLRFVRVR